MSLYHDDHDSSSFFVLKRCGNLLSELDDNSSVMTSYCIHSAQKEGKHILVGGGTSFNQKGVAKPHNNHVLVI